MSSYPHIKEQIDPFVHVKDDPDYKPKLPDHDKIKNYKNIE